MKKRLIVSATLAVLGLSTLASCSSGEDGDLTIVRSDFSEKVDLSLVKDKYSINWIFDLENSAKRLDSTNELDSNSDYYTVYVSNNIVDTAFLNSINIDEDLANETNRVQSYSFNALTFKGDYDIYESEKPAIADKLYDAEYGLNQYKDAFGFTINTVKAFSFNVPAQGAKAAYDAGVRGITLDIVYVPTFVVRNYGSESMQKQKIIEKVVFAPIYVTYSADGKEIDNGNFKDTKIASIRREQIDFNGNYVATGKEEA